MKEQSFSGVLDLPFDEGMQDKYFEKVKLQLSEMPPRPRARMLLDANSLSASRGAGGIDTSVVGQSLVVFDDKLGEDDKQDALDSQAFAEAILRRMPKGSSQEQQYAAYNEALSAIGWVTESYTRKTYDSKKTTLTMNDAILQVLETVVSASSGNVLGMVAAGFDKLKGDKPALKIVDTTSKRTDLVSFKAVPCIVAPGGGMAMVMGAVDVYSKNFDGDYLFFTFNTEGIHLFQSAAIRKFNKRAFGRKRQMVYDFIDQNDDGLFKKLTGM